MISNSCPRNPQRTALGRLLLISSASILLVLPVAGCQPRLHETTSQQAEPLPVPQYDPKMRELLDASLLLGREYLMANQTPEGRFHYEVDLRTGELSDNDHEVRQAGGLWGLTLIHQEMPTPDTRASILKGFEYFSKHYGATEEGGLYVVYPGSRQGYTNTVALVALSLIDFLRVEGRHPGNENLQRDLDQYIQFLLSLRREDGLFYGYYDTQSGRGVRDPNPYADGEALLTLIKAARYAGREDLQQTILESAEQMHDTYVVQAQKIERDSRLTKGFYQWGSMAFLELYGTGWEGSQKYAKRTIDMANWMIEVHNVLSMLRNTAYAFEGLCSAWELARVSGDRVMMNKIGRTIDVGLTNLTSWQVGSPNQNNYLATLAEISPLATGGVMNEKALPTLRIDVTQHQMHAVILARRYCYPKQEASENAADSSP